jgi:hypothetical protein
MNDQRPIALLAWAAVAVGVIHLGALIRPTLLFDDYDILVRSWTWADARAGLWVPQNEHAMPLGRLTTWVLVQVSPDVRYLAYLSDLQGVVGVMLALPLVYLFVRREVGLPLAGVLAAVLFGVTSIYQQAVVWFASSFSVLALDTFLVGLLAAQAWRQTGRWLYLVGCLLACLLAPGWFASGILAGPLCFLYLLVPTRKAKAGDREGEAKEREGEAPAEPVTALPFGVLNFAPLVGTALFLAVALPQVAQTILHLEHYQGQTALEAFNPIVGLGYTARSLIDNLALGQFGITRVCVPVWLVAILLPTLVGLFALYVWPAHQWRLVITGAATILAAYLLTYSARSRWDYVEADFFTHHWNRYHLFPQLGLSLIVAAGLPYWLPRLGTWLRPENSITPGQGRAVCVLIVCLTLIHLPRGLLAPPKVWEEWVGEQWAGFARLAEVEARCHEHGISRAAALEALPPWHKFTGAGEGFNAWLLLHGSPSPRELPPEEVRRLLLE